MNPTIKDVAKHAGVSVATVSRYLNNSPLIAPASIEKVKNSMEELNYQPNFIAKSLSKQASLNIAFVVDGSNLETTGNDSFLRIQYGAEQQLNEKGYFLMIISIDGAKSGEVLLEKLAKEKRIDGMIIPADLISENLISILQKLNFPFVVFGKKSNKTVYLLDLDNAMGSRLAVNKLLEGKSSKIGFVTNSFDKIFVQERFQGYRDALNDANIVFSEANVVDGCYDNRDGYNYVMENESLCDAYVVTDNMVAFGMLRAMRERNLRVPEDIQLVSFDNTVLAKLSEPPMTVIDIDVTELGRCAANMLLEQVEKKTSESRQCLMPVTLIEGGTTMKK